MRAWHAWWAQAAVPMRLAAGVCMVLAALVLAGLAWWWGLSPAAKPAAAPAGVAAPGWPPGPSPLAAWPGPQPEASAPPEQPASQAAAEMKLAPHCGLGWLPGEPQHKASKAQLEEAAAAAALQAQRDVVARLRSSADELSRAVGVLLAGSDFVLPAQDMDACIDEGAPPSASQAIASQPSCEALQRQRAAALAARQRDTATERAALIEQAQRTQSPAVYALALQACRSGRVKTPACGGLSTARWAELDPDNAAPWLALAEEAKDEPALQDQAIERASQATHQDADLSWITQQVQQALPAEIQGQVRLQLLVAATGIGNAQVYSGYQAVGRWCADESLADPGRRGICGRLGELMTAHGSSMLDLGLGIRLLEQTGLAPDRLQALQDRRQAYTDALQGIATENWLMGTPPSGLATNQHEASHCLGLLRMSAFLGDVAAQGELATLQRFLARKRAGTP